MAKAVSVATAGKNDLVASPMQALITTAQHLFAIPSERCIGLSWNQKTSECCGGARAIEVGMPEISSFCLGVMHKGGARLIYQAGV